MQLPETAADFSIFAGLVSASEGGRWRERVSLGAVNDLGATEPRLAPAVCAKIVNLGGGEADGCIPTVVQGAVRDTVKARQALQGAFAGEDFLHPFVAPADEVIRHRKPKRVVE